MKLKDSLPKFKGMIFAGCSFTWGQGLYYYSNLDSLVEPPVHTWHPKYMNFAHYEYMKKIRFPKLVADHFNTFEVCQWFNGGGIDRINNYWLDRFVEENDTLYHIDNHEKKYQYQDFSHIIYQCTQWERMMCRDPITESIMPYNHILSNHTKAFMKWLDLKNISLQEYENNLIEKHMTLVKNFLHHFENKGIKSYIFTWPANLVKYIKNDPWLNERFIEFSYKNKCYSNIEDLMGPTHLENHEVENPELIIFRDLEYFETPPADLHPSPKCHKVIADCIIKKIEKNN